MTYQFRPLFGRREGKVEAATSDFFQALAFGTPENAGVSLHFRPFWAPREGSGDTAPSDFVARGGFGPPRNHLEERLLDQAHVQASYTPFFWGHSRSIPRGMIFMSNPL